jgi:hypothetical protein
MLVLAAREEHCSGKAPAGAEHGGAEGGAADPELGMLAPGGAPIDLAQAPQARRQEHHYRLPEGDEIARAHRPEKRAEEQAQRHRRADGHGEAAIDIVAALAQRVGDAPAPDLG